MAMAGRGAAHHDALTSRCLAFAEGVATMASPVLLALALKKDKWQSEVQDPALPMAMLAAFAAATLFTGICPTLACCASEMFPAICEGWPSPTRGFFAFVSSACLLVIACGISLLGVVSESSVIIVGALAVIFLLVRAVSYMMPQVVDQQLNQQEANELCSMVDKSLEFISGITGILFLGLEGMALEGLASATAAYPGTEHALLLQPHMCISFIFCAAGVVLIFLEMVPPLDAAKMGQVLYLTDIAMFVGTAALLTSLLCSMLLGPRKAAAFLILFVPYTIILQLAYINSNAARGQRQAAGELQLTTISVSSSAAPPPPPPEHGGDNQGGQHRAQEDKPAPMGLTKLTFTGFLAVSVKAISGGSPASDWTLCFLVFAATAIISGVSWRLVTHAHYKDGVGAEATARSASIASFATHFSVAVATILFAVVAWEVAASTKDQ